MPFRRSLREILSILVAEEDGARGYARSRGSRLQGAESSEDESRWLLSNPVEEKRGTPTFVAVAGTIGRYILPIGRLYIDTK